MGSFVAQEAGAGNVIETVQRVHVAYAEAAPGNVFPRYPQAATANVPAKWVFRTRAAAAAWAADRIDARIAELMALHARWTPLLSAED